VDFRLIILKTAVRATAETRRATCENRLPSGFEDDSFSAFEHRVAKFSFTLLLRAKMEGRQALSLFLFASPRLRGYLTVGSMNLRSSAQSASHEFFFPRFCASVALPNRI
jgi:hypothetical protein